MTAIDPLALSPVGTELLDNDPANDGGCLDSDPNTACSNVTLNQLDAGHFLFA